MKIAFNPSVSFKQNLIEEKKNEAIKNSNPKVNSGINRQYPTSWGPDPHLEEIKEEVDKFLKSELKKEDNSSTQTPAMKSLTPEEIEKSQKDFMATLEEGKSLEGIIKGEHWEKTYDRGDNSVHLKIPNSYDGAEYTIKSDGTVIKTSGWSNPEVKMDANERMAKYVKAMKEGKVEEFLKEDEVQQAHEYSNGNLTANEKTKEELFYNTLKDRQWKKEYLPESDIIVIRHKKIKDGVDYMIEKDGTVKEFGLRIKPSVIVEPSIEGAKRFGELKAKLYDGNPQQKTSLWYKMKKGVSNIWKFFSVAGTMAAATTRGLIQGAIGAAGVLAATTLVRGTVSLIKGQTTFIDIVKNPLKTAGKTGGALAAITAAGCIAVNMVEGRMKANQNSAVIEHKLDVEHDLT